MDTITHRRLLEVLSYDPGRGAFTWRVSLGSRAVAGRRAGSLSPTGYLRVMVDKRFYYLHRLAVLYASGRGPFGHVDHINGVKDDNRIENLRDVDRSTNMQNLRGAKKGNQAGLLGAHYRKDTGRWTSTIRTSAGKVALGCYATAEEAHQIYMTAKRNLHAGCTI